MQYYYSLMKMNNPLIITALLNDDAQHFFDAQRKRYFPADKNFLAAHLTLFHQLPPGEPFIQEAMEECCNGQKIIVIKVTELVFTGKGVAYKLESKELKLLHKRLQQKWFFFLTTQDRQGLWPHITVQNKVLPNEAKALFMQLQPNLAPVEIAVTGLVLWEYLNGPWRLLKRYVFEE